MNEERFDMFRFPLKRVPTHPGKLLREYWEGTGITQMHLAKRLGVSFQAINDLINQKKSVSPEMAVRLSTFFRTSVELWLGMQNKHDVYKILLDEKKSDQLKKITPFEYKKELELEEVEV